MQQNASKHGRATPGPDPAGSVASIVGAFAQTHSRPDPGARAGHRIDPVDTGRARRVLVVEDEQLVRELVVEVLDGHGLEVEACENGSLALERLRGSGRFDLLFTDIVMPDGPDGVELASLARALQPGLRVLLASGYSKHISMNRETAKRGTRFLAKPYRLAQLLEVVDDLLRNVDPV